MVWSEMSPLLQHLEALKGRAEPEPGVLEALLLKDWRYLYPFRLRFREPIQRTLAALPEGFDAARAAFGQLDPAKAPGWLYRDFYVGSPPAALSVDRALGKLRRGDPSELIALLGNALPQEHDYRSIWYDVCTLVGQLVGQPRVLMGRERHAPVLSADMPILAGGPPPLVENASEVSQALILALRGELGLEAHRRRMLGTLEQLLAGAITTTEESFPSALVLLQQHTDAPGDPLGEALVQQRPFSLGTSAVSITQRLGELEGLREALSDERGFREHLRRGLGSPSRPRRFLSYRLLLWKGDISADTHPDDLAGWASGAG